MTENISRGGVLVSWKASGAVGLPEPGDLLTLEIELPARHSFGRKCMHCVATVSRVVRTTNGAHRVGLQVAQMRFRESGSDHDDAASEVLGSLTQYLM